ncbi:MAG: ComF family protein [Gammaproteobacteria bacterium]|nr:MAG: ComF family protein [Gammaproteobacteria bacterium]
MYFSVYNRLRNIQDWLFPGNCLLCRARLPAGADLCPSCDASLPRPEAACPRCAAPLASDAAGNCGACQQRPPAFDAAKAAFRYAAPVDRLIQDLKYHRRLTLARVLGRRLADHVAACDVALPDVIVPVPLHAVRLRERGYNQSLEIARVVSQQLKVPVSAHGAVERVRATVSQTKLAPEARARNVRNAFRISGDFAGQCVALVDDVMTSGHTAAALAKSLKHADASRVSVWVVARAG